MLEPQLILASQSPRRAELLRQLQVRFTQFGVDIDEQAAAKETPDNLVARLALEKAQAGQRRGLEKGDVYSQVPVLGSDTIVVVDGQIMGKPENEAHARQMLTTLSGRTHEVKTAVAVVAGGEIYQQTVTTEVTFKHLSAQEISWYWASREPRDKAGGYGIQGLAGQFVSRINGSYSAVVGLPLYETSQLLIEAGIKLYER